MPATLVTDRGALAKRILGAVIVAVAVVTLDSSVESALHQLWLPLLIALGAYLITESLLATTLATTLLTALHTEFASQYWWASIAYPSIAVLGTLVMGTLSWKRFRTRIQQTHEVRWQERKARARSTAQPRTPDS